MSFRLRRPDLTIDDPWNLVRGFFETNPSSVGTRPYDSYIASQQSPANRIVEEDVVAINTSMSARSPHAHWKALMARGDLPELEAVATEWDLFVTSDDIWIRHQVPDVLLRLFDVVTGKGIGISRATKVLHIKRPNLIPVCDSYVLRLMGIPGEDGSGAIALIEHLRSIREDLLPTLDLLHSRLMERGIDRPLVRIADCLIWGSWPDTRVQRA